MAKKLVAVTNIKTGSAPDEYYPAGTELDAAKFTKAQLAELHDNGAIEIVDSTSVEDVQASVTVPATTETTDKPTTSTTSAATPAKTEEPKK